MPVDRRNAANFTPRSGQDRARQSRGRSALERGAVPATAGSTTLGR
jgi:hypothetical protein